MASDIHELGRLGEARGGARRMRRVPVRRGRGPARRQPRVPRSLWGLAMAAVLLAGVGLVAAGNDLAGDRDGATAIPMPPERPDTGVERVSRGDARDPVATTFARIDGLALTLPHDRPALVAFAEGGRAEALALEPLGRLQVNDHPRYDPAADGPGPDYVVLPSLGRPRAPTSGVDIAVSPDAQVSAPVSGTVVTVREYALAGGGRDYRIVIEPQDRPSLHVLLTHVQDPSVAVGDRVVAGTTPVGAARTVPGPHAVDAYLDGAFAHVRVEVKPAGEPEPADPNEAALPAEDAVDGR